MEEYIKYNDEELIELLRTGDEAAFRQLYARYWERLFVIAGHRLASSQEAEEAVHDIFLRVWKRRTLIKIEVSVNHYLAAAIKFEVISRLRTRHRRDTLLEGHLQQTASYPTDAITWLEEKELFEELERTVQALPEKCRIVFRLSREQGYTNRQIADELGISENTVESHMKRALRALRKRFGDTPSVLLLFI